MLKKFLNKYYPPFINLYTVWILYMMFFAYYRGWFPAENYFIRAKPFESIHYLLYNPVVTSIEMYKNIFGNIILFVPYGFLGILYPKFNFYKYLFLVFVIVINILEFSQYYFGRGYAEFDDVMLNTLGMSIGYIIYKKWFFIRGR